MLLIIIFCLLVGKINCNSRIIGGWNAEPGQFPYQVSLQLNKRHYCGGSLIKNDVVITAAHCTNNQNPLKLRIIAGYVDLLSPINKTYSVARIIVHEKYNAKTQDNDISLLKLNVPIEYTVLIQPIELAPVDIKIPADTIGTISGYGVINELLELPNRLKYAYVQLWSRDYCNSLNVPGVTDRMICAGHPSGQISSCQGDSGGPLTVEKKLVGLVSWGFGCGVKGRPAVYTYVPAFLTWIKENM